MQKVGDGDYLRAVAREERYKLSIEDTEGKI